MIAVFLAGFAREVVSLFLEMAPYLVLGLTVAGVLSVLVNRAFVVRRVGHPGLASVIKAAVLGVPLPLCSCGVVPTAAYLRRSGASKPAIMSFLIATPQTGVDSIAATYGMLGPLFAVFRPLAALVTGVAGGSIAALTDPQADGASLPGSAEAGEAPSPVEREGTALGPIRRIARYAFVETVDDIAVHFVVGLVLAGLISILIPDDFFAGSIMGRGFPAMVLMVVIGVPMYVCSTSSIPIAVALIAKGFSPGAAYVFLVAGPATNAATLSVLLRVLGRRQTFVYVATIVAGSLLFGPLMDSLVGSGMPGMLGSAGENAGYAADAAETGVFATVLGVFLLVLLVWALYRRYGPAAMVRPGRALSQVPTDGVPGENVGIPIGTAAGDDGGSAQSVSVPVTVLSVNGMTCHYCETNVKSALGDVAGIENVTVDLKANTATIRGTHERATLVAAVEGAGYSVVPGKRGNGR